MAKQKKGVLDCKHPNSRKTRTLIKQTKKTSKRDKQKVTTSVKQNITGEKIAWFRDNLESECALTPRQLGELIQKYLARFNEELEQIRIKHSVGNRKNRQYASREDIITMTIKRDREEFNTCGLEAPDLLDPKQFEMIKTWKGELRFLQNFKLKRYSREQLELLEAKFSKQEERRIHASPSQPSSEEAKTRNSSNMDIDQLQVH